MLDYPGKAGLNWPNERGKGPPNPTSGANFPDGILFAFLRSRVSCFSWQKRLRINRVLGKFLSARPAGRTRVSSSAGIRRKCGLPSGSVGMLNTSKWSKSIRRFTRRLIRAWSSAGARARRRSSPSTSNCTSYFRFTRRRPNCCRPICSDALKSMRKGK